MTKLSEYLTIGEAAGHLGVSKDSLRRWDRAGKLVARRHPASCYRLYLKKELDAVLRELRDGGVATRRENRPRKKQAKRKR